MTQPSPRLSPRLSPGPLQRFRLSPWSALLVVTALAAACASEPLDDPSTPDRDADASEVLEDGVIEDIAVPPDGSGADAGEDVGRDGVASEVDAEPVPPLPLSLCSDEPPAGATRAPAPPSYRGGEACPELVPGRNTIRSAGRERAFLLVTPDEVALNERLPLLFLWHWLGGSARGFLEIGEIQEAVDGQFRWPYTRFDSDRDVEDELAFFDDVLACVSAQYPVNRDCVASGGVSAGALWTVQLAMARSVYLSSIVVLSGGTGDFWLRPWDAPERALPALVLWGGPTDRCAVDFHFASRDFEAELDAAGHFFVECVHNCGHSTPPIDPAEGYTAFGGFWDFVLEHPYWVPTGRSPYHVHGLSPSLPEWCGLGSGGAEMREGECSGSGCF